MASRRTRIKGIANIPQRRKTNPTPNDGEEVLDKENNVEEKPITEDVVEKSNETTTENVKNVAPSNFAGVRRKFIKPRVSLETLNRKSRSEQEPQIAESKSTEEQNKVIVLSNQIIKPIDEGLIQKKCEVTLEETQIVGKSEPPTLDLGIKKVFTTQNVDYPPPPASPSKINRSRIKAIPRLHQRKTSFSASESEDENRRNFNRHRNDSVCSAASTAPDSLSECMSPQRPKEFNSIIQKKCRRSEQSRKLANARMDFYVKFGNNKPDRQKLTMIDLIFYNPTTNPMSDPKKKESGAEEDPDDPEILKIEETEKEQSDDENEMPVPQIKIGPSGEIILDEQSLVVENKETKKHRKELQKSKLVDGDFDTGYGVYKRMKRSKDWSSAETLRFYKALNTIGTDFSLMCELFPRRTRRELKMKFKKEERINLALVDKAMTQPCDFDFAELKQEVDLEEQELQELELQKANDAKNRKLKEERLARKRKLAEEQKLKVRKVRRRKTLDINSVLEDSDADVSDVDSVLSDSEATSLALKPTRSGRMPKMTKKFDPLEENLKPNEKLESGELMVASNEDPDGNAVYKVFMVTDENNVESENIFTITQQKIQQ